MKRLAILFVVIAMVLLIANSVRLAVAAPVGATYRVSTSGNNGWPGTAAQPWRTIQHAVDSVSAGDTIEVATGVYAENVYVNQSGDATNGPIVIKALAGNVPVVDGGNTRTHGFYLEDRSYIVIDGFEIRNQRSTANWTTAAGIEVNGESHSIELLNNVIHDVVTASPDPLQGIANGIAVFGTDPNPSTNITVRGNELYDLRLGWSESLTLNGNIDGFAVTDNEVHDNNNIGIDIIGGEEWIENDYGVPTALNKARNGVVSGNLVYNIDGLPNPVYTDRSAACIYVDGGENVVIEHNVARNCNFGMSMSSERLGWNTTSVTVRNNFIALNHTGGLVLGGSGVGNGGTISTNIYNNTFYQNDTDANGGGEVWVQRNVLNVEVKNNIFYASSQDLFVSKYNSVPSAISFDYNLYYAPDGVGEWVWQGSTYTGLATWQSSTGLDVNGLFADPQFTVVGDYHIAATSLAVNNGTNLGAGFGSLDLDLETRVFGPAVDIGADEVQSTPTAVTVLDMAQEAEGGFSWLTLFYVVAGATIGVLFRRWWRERRR